MGLRRHRCLADESENALPSQTCSVDSISAGDCSPFSISLLCLKLTSWKLLAPETPATPQQRATGLRLPDLKGTQNVKHKSSSSRSRHRSICWRRYPGRSRHVGNGLRLGSARPSAGHLDLRIQCYHLGLGRGLQWGAWLGHERSWALLVRLLERTSWQVDLCQGELRQRNIRMHRHLRRESPDLRSDSHSRPFPAHIQRLSDDGGDWAGRSHRRTARKGFGPPIAGKCTCLCAHVRDSMLRDPLLATIPLATERGRVGIMGGDWVICDAQNFQHSRAHSREEGLP